MCTSRWPTLIVRCRSIATSWASSSHSGAAARLPSSRPAAIITISRSTPGTVSAAPPPGPPGLYHRATLYPARALLADALRRVLAAGIELDGASDHGVSEALYL